MNSASTSLKSGKSKELNIEYEFFLHSNHKCMLIISEKCFTNFNRIEVYGFRKMKPAINRMSNITLEDQHDHFLFQN